MSATKTDNKPNTPSQTSPDKAALELRHPGPEHAELAKLAGAWDVTVNMWMKEGEEPASSTGTANYTTVLDGRFLQEVFSGTIFGKPFSGLGLMGFDRAHKRYVSTWCDSMSTGIISTIGTGARNGQEITFTGTTQCASTNAPMKIRHLHKRESNDRFTLTMFNDKDGKERKAMELTYTRKH